MVELLIIKAEDKNLRLTVEVDSEVPYLLYGDPFRLRQVLYNLIENAIKFSDEGQISLKLSVKEKKDTYTLLFTLEDNGIGIPLSLQEKIFKSFSQVDESSTRQYDGAGLGLALCKELIELAGGTVWVDSEPGSGSVFSFTFVSSIVAQKIPPYQLNNSDGWKHRLHHHLSKAAAPLQLPSEP